ncbi:MAG: phosphatase PAP2 family protein [Cyclobacteriaceae bacterium]|nr:phosphatase PAP2 family protein [Cyclobacteriaceae bacterium HetDA_MAG_MS6]
MIIDKLKEWDLALFDVLNGFGYPYLNIPMIWLSDKYIWIPLYLFLIYKLHQKYQGKVWVPLLAILLIITLADQLTSSLMKPYFERLRPCREQSLKELVIVVAGCGGKYGFASSHAANTMGLATFFSKLYPNTLGYLLIAWALLVSYSRVYLGVHYPGDIVVGMLLGVILGLCAYQLVRKKLSTSNQS